MAKVSQEVHDGISLYHVAAMWAGRDEREWREWVVL